MRIRIGTRKSRLAMVQTEIVRDRIRERFPQLEIELVPMSTKGDQILDRSLTSFGGKGVFTKELEEALLDGRVDLAVHSAKDLPMELPEGLTIGAVLARGNPGDVLVTATGIPVRALPAGSVIGTSSLRRELQIRRLNPQVRIKLLRGNVPTRLQKLKSGEYDGILLAAAGLERLGLDSPEGLFLEYLDTEEFVPAAGQGILAVEIRSGEMADVMTAIHSAEAEAMLFAERKYLTDLGGSCNAPCGAYCRREGDSLTMTAMYSKDGSNLVFRKESVYFPEEEPLAGGRLKRAAGELAASLVQKVRLQTVSLVGAGPGDVGLLTCRGLECVRRADVILYDNLISGSILNHARLDAELIYAGKRSGEHYLKQDQINALLVEKALSGNYVVRLKGGDPFVFGRGGEEALELQKHGIPFEVVPGVSSSYSVLAYGGIPVTHRGLASSFHVITGHEEAGKKEPALDYATLAREEGTLVFLMGLKHLRRIAEALMAHGKPKETPAAVIQQGTTAMQRTVVSTLEHLADEVARAGIRTPAIIVVGAVVSLKDRLDWFGRGPLAGKRVLVTGTRRMVEEQEPLLRSLGAEVTAVSLIESIPSVTEALTWAVKELEAYSWAVFTSINGVEIFFETLKSLSIDLRSLMHLKFAAVGQRTGEALFEHGFCCDFVPERFSGEDLAKEWIPGLGEGDRVLLLRAKEASPVIPEALSAAGIPFTDVPLYETWVDERRREELDRAVQEADYVTVASGSAVRAFHELLPELPADVKLISIGPSTTKAAEELGIAVHKSAAEYTAEGMAAAILADVAENGGDR